MHRPLARVLAPLLLSAAIAAATSACKPEPRKDAVPRPDSIVPAYHLAPSPAPLADSAVALPLGGVVRAVALTRAWPGAARFPQAGPDSTVKLKARAYLKGTFLAADTLRYDYLRNDSLQVTRRSVFSLDSATVGAPPYGGTARYTVCVQVERNGRTSGQVSAKACWATPWVYTRPMPPMPSVDSLVQVAIRPALGAVATAVALTSATQVPGDSNRVQMCAFGVMSSGRKVKLKNSWNIPACELAFQRFLAEVPD